MHKNFERWFVKKREIQNQSQNKFYRPREIWWCYLGENIGFEQDGTGKEHQRPVLIIRAFSKYVCLIVPLTTSIKKNPYHVAIGMVDNKMAYAIISQIRLIDTRRLINRIAILNTQYFLEIKKTIKGLL